MPAADRNRLSHLSVRLEDQYALAASLDLRLILLDHPHAPVRLVHRDRPRQPGETRRRFEQHFSVAIDLAQRLSDDPETVVVRAVRQLKPAELLLLHLLAR